MKATFETTGYRVEARVSRSAPRKRQGIGIDRSYAVIRDYIKDGLGYSRPVATYKSDAAATRAAALLDELKVEEF